MGIKKFLICMFLLAKSSQIYLIDRVEDTSFELHMKDQGHQNLIAKTMEEKKSPQIITKKNLNHKENTNPVKVSAYDISLDAHDRSILPKNSSFDAKSEKEQVAKKNQSSDNIDFLHNDISSAADKLSMSAESDFSDDKKTKEQDLRKYLEKLPKKNQPSDMNQALKLIKDGEIVAGLIEQGSFFDAIMHNFSKDGLASDEDKVLWKKSFNTSDADFWAIIKNDKVLAKKASHHSIPFTIESLKSVENGMYFRSTYARINSAEGLSSLVDAYQKSIVQLQWHLFSLSVLQEGRAFSSGMISVQDSKFSLFKFLDGYAELVSPKYKLHSAISFHSLATTKAYTRESSHYSGAKRFKFDCGIDIQDSNNQPLSILPGNKSHILFGLRSNDMVFVKWENYGVTFNPAESDMSMIPHIKGYFDKKDKSDDPILERREKISDDVMAEFKKLYNDKKITKKDKKNIEAHGVSYMIKMLDPNSQELFKKYLVNTKKYSESSLNNRKGNEIILQSLQG